jgi:ferritin-like metal-binding protein YciE
MRTDSFIRLYVSELEKLHSMELELAGGLPRMAAAAHNKELLKVLHDQIRAARRHATRLEKIFTDLGVSKGTEVCRPFQELIRESQELTEAYGDPEVRDAALIARVRSLFQGKAVLYDTAQTFARHLALNDQCMLLHKTLVEQEQAIRTLRQLAEEGWFADKPFQPRPAPKETSFFSQRVWI